MTRDSQSKVHGLSPAISSNPVVTDPAAPWAGKTYSYAGWIPNVHSHLSFSLIGSGRGPEVAFMSPRYFGRLCRFVCVLQRRETDDFLAPMWWTRLFRPQAIQHFLLVGSTVEIATPIGVTDLVVEVPPKRRTVLGWKAFERFKLPSGADRGEVQTQQRRSVETALDDQGMLQGQLFVLPRQKPRKARREQRDWLKNLRKRLRDAENEKGGPQRDVELDRMPSSLANDIANCSPFSVRLEFALFRTGEVRIWFEDDVAKALTFEARREITRQCYYFMKDMVHHHVHHEAKSDQITPLTAVGSGDTDHSDSEPNHGEDRGEELWRRETVWSLSRAVDALARRGKLQDLREATGILAYADAFQKTLLLYRRQHKNPARFEPNPVTYRYDFAHIRESLKVQLDQVTSRRTTLSQLIIAGLAGCIAATSLLVSAVSAFNGAAKHKLDLQPVLLGVPTEALRISASAILVPAFGVGTLLWLVSSVLLSEDRIGTKRTERRKCAQFVRGVSNSIAVRLGRTGRAVQIFLELFYLTLFVSLAAFTYHGIPHVIAAARHVSTMQVTFGNPSSKDPLQSNVNIPLAGKASNSDVDTTESDSKRGRQDGPHHQSQSHEPSVLTSPTPTASGN